MTCPTSSECESFATDFMHCLVQNKADRDSCVEIEKLLRKCDVDIKVMKGVPTNTSFCSDEMFDYAKCSINPNTSMCANEYKMLHECKLRRRRFLLGEDLGLLQVNPQARKRW